jgi:hypothetical protein
VRTEQLIAALAQDRTVGSPPSRRLSLELACGAGLTVLLFLLLLGLRPHLPQALAQPRVLIKPVLGLCLAACAMGLLLRLARPARPAGRWGALLWLAPGLLLAAVAVELSVVPSALWVARAVGHNAFWCLTMIPLFAVPPLGCLLHALKGAAPTRPAATGAVAGLVAGGLASAAYALHCTDDSPLFVATWYALAVAIVTAAGAVVGGRMLRW